MDLRDKLSSLSVSPPKILKIVIGLSVVLLLMWLFTLSQIDYTGEDTESRVFQQEQTGETHSADSSSSEAGAVDGYRDSSSMFSNGLVTFFVLIIILALIWFWVDRSDTSGTAKKRREIGSHSLGEGVQLKIVRMNNEVWVLGVASASVNLLHRYPEDEWQEPEAGQQATAADSDTFAKLFRDKL